MRRLVKLSTKLFLPILLALATVPTFASEKVCVVIPNGKAIPFGKCGMPCCHMRTVAAVPTPKDCCLHQTTTQTQTCTFGNMSCRCETRITASINSAPIAPLSGAFVPADQPAPLSIAVYRSVDLIEFPSVQICGVLTRGPPPKTKWFPDLGRAPPFPA